jgi:2,4-dienoyl-CoA reductase-like NADH-dependent reductase (Old Yellow Enzyme family)/thioredoxin reductase
LSLKYPHLFEPLAIGGVVFRNRIFASPKGYYNVAKDNLPGADEIAFFEREAVGGYASVCIGDCIVDSATGTHYPFLIRMDDSATLPGLSAVADAIKRHGAVASAELSHAGMYARFVKEPDSDVYGPEAAAVAGLNRDGKGGGALYGPVAMADGKYGEVEAMPEELIYKITEKYGRAAAWAKRCGFNMVTIHGGHGWLLAQFMSPFVNTRGDMWGGSFDNRMRFPLAVVESVRKAVGASFPIEMRISGSECDDKGYDIAEGVKIAKALDGKVDIIHVSAGNHEFDDTFIITHPSIFMPDGANVKYAAEIKRSVKTPVATVGALTDPDMMEEILRSGQADIVALGRQSLCDPDLPVKARSGREGDINKCMRCCQCFGEAGGHRNLRCAIRPETGREIEEKSYCPPRAKKRVLVAGGGVGGMQAALSAAGRGHEVILCEKTDGLGGVLRCESLVPFKRRLEEYLDLQVSRIKRAPVEVMLNTEVTRKFAKEIRPDVIVASLGARPAVPQLPGIDGKNVTEATRLYVNPDAAGERVVVLGGGLVGLELAIFMAMRGHASAVVEIAPELSVDVFGMHRIALAGKIAELGIPVHTATRALEITERGVDARGPEGGVFFEADTVVYATGQIPLREECAEIHDCAPEFYQIGDCFTPRNIMAATQEAYAIARDIGRL